MRTYKNNELRIEHVGMTATLVVLGEQSPQLGGLLFIDLREPLWYDPTHMQTRQQCTWDSQKHLKVNMSFRLPDWSLNGKAKTPIMETGDIEVELTELTILSEANQPPMIIADKTDALEDFRMNISFLDLRRPIMQHNLMLRHQITRAVRQYFDAQDFMKLKPCLWKINSGRGP
jgi:aspartyl-tRNA synthetase